MTSKKKIENRAFELVWSPEGRKLGVFFAPTPKAARRLAPKPFSKFHGEISVTDLGPESEWFEKELSKGDSPTR